MLGLLHHFSDAVTVSIHSILSILSCRPSLSSCLLFYCHHHPASFDPVPRHKASPFAVCFLRCPPSQIMKRNSLPFLSRNRMNQILWIEFVHHLASHPMNRACRFLTALFLSPVYSQISQKL